MKNSPSIDPGTIRAYLLGDLCPEDMDDIEKAYFASEEALDEVAAVEQEMIEEYLARSSSDASAFESRYLGTPPHRLRVALVRELQRRAPPSRSMGRIFPFALAAAILIAAGLGFVLIRRGGPAGERAAVAPAPGGSGTASSSSSAAMVAITLPAIMVRGEGETPTIRLGAEDAGITLRLERGEAAPVAAAEPYRVTVRTVEGEEIWKGEAAAATGAESTDGAGTPLVASVTIPAASIVDGDYVVVLAQGRPGSPDAPAADAEIQRYFFRLVRR